MDHEILLEREKDQSIKEKYNEGLNHIKTLYVHLLKMQFQPSEQTGAWCNSIANAHNGLVSKFNNPSVLNKVQKSDLEKRYKKAIEKASNETGLDKSVFPSTIPNSWTVENLMDSKFLYKYIDTFAVTDGATKWLENPKSASLLEFYGEGQYK